LLREVPHEGKPAFIEGSLRLDTWDDKNGGGKRSRSLRRRGQLGVRRGGRGEGSDRGAPERGAPSYGEPPSGGEMPERDASYQQADDTPF
jgi:single-strand DNA-binding protein